MKRRTTAGYAAGYTILEVMIVLAVTGALFISTVLMLGGKQAQNEVTQAMRNYETQLQNVASEVANGYYPNGFSCVPLGTSVSVTANPAPVGGNLGCVFLGKIINVHETYAEIVTMVGRQYDVTTKADVITLGQAAPKVVANGFVNKTVGYVNQYDLKVSHIVSLQDSTIAYQSIAFVIELGGGFTSANGTNGSRSILLYGIKGNAATNTSTDTALNLGNLLPIPEGVRMCMIGGNGKKTELILGEAGSQTGTSVLIDNGVSDVCA